MHTLNYEAFPAKLTSIVAVPLMRNFLSTSKNTLKTVVIAPFYGTFFPGMSWSITYYKIILEGEVCPK